VRLGPSRDPGGNWEIGATLGEGLLGGETNCAQGASYCDAPQREFFFGLQVNGDSAIVIHGVGPDGESNLWSTIWFDDGAGAIYYLAVGSAVTGTDASAYPRGKSPAHVSAAQQLASLATKLVLWAPDNQQGNSAGTQPQGGSSQSQVITCSAGHLLGQGEVSYVCDDGYVYDVNPDPIAPSVSKLVAQSPNDFKAVATWPQPSMDQALRNPRWVDDQGRTCALEGADQGVRIICTTGDDAATQ
jgi:hypothetical protein